MTDAVQIYTGGPVFDGTRLRDGMSVVASGGRVLDIVPAAAAPEGKTHLLNGDILCPAFVDLQVNGGGGVLLNDAPTEAGLTAIAAAHRAAGTGTFLPTLITDTPEVTRAAIEAVAQTNVPGVAGLHLEGPHLDVAKMGAHDPDLIRPMTGDDLALYQDAARRLPRLVITLAPEAVSTRDIAALAEAGVVVSLGHSAASFETALAAFKAGASMVTHLFNAMPPLHHRQPGLVAAALSMGDVTAGLIADGEHVHPAMIGAAFRAKVNPQHMFLVTDAMAPFGTGMRGFTLNGREITVDGPRLTLADGTLAGANTDMLGMIRIMVNDADVPLKQALAMATSTPARAATLPAPAGELTADGPLPLRIKPDLSAMRPLI